MERQKQKKPLRKPLKITLIVLGAIVALCLAVMAICMVPLQTEDIAVSAMQTEDGVTVRELEGVGTAFVPDKTAIAGLIFYPGARVQNEAYAPLMHSLAEQGILTVVVDVPFCLAFFDVNAADGVAEQFPEVDSWYVGGHSLGAAIAGKYLSHHTDTLDGLVMFAGFVTDDLSETDVNVISVYGDRDGVLSDGLYEKYRSELPESLSEFVIEGGNHAGFAYYGDQMGDNAAEIPKAQQISVAAQYCAEQIESFLIEKENSK